MSFLYQAPTLANLLFQGPIMTIIFIAPIFQLFKNETINISIIISFLENPISKSVPLNDLISLECICCCLETKNNQHNLFTGGALLITQTWTVLLCDLSPAATRPSRLYPVLSSESTGQTDRKYSVLLVHVQLSDRSVGSAIITVVPNK